MILINGKPLKKSSIFPGGEIHIELPDLGKPGCILVIAKLKNANDIMELVLVKNAIDNAYPDVKVFALRMMYVPYARQDRICRQGEAFSIQAFSTLIRSLNFSAIMVADIHSDSAFGMLNPTINVSLKDIFRAVQVKYITNSFAEFVDFTHTPKGVINSCPILIAPDKGAFDKVSKLAEEFDNNNGSGRGIVVASKRRDRVSGEIVGTYIAPGHMPMFGRNLLIVDDICDGGRTFIELAKQLQLHKPKSISLYVTHGIFSKGIEPLLAAGISKIYTTDSFTDLKPIKGVFNVWPIQEIDFPHL